jgi:hypothetical protein
MRKARQLWLNIRPRISLGGASNRVWECLDGYCAGVPLQADHLCGGRRVDLLNDAGGYHRYPDDTLEALVESRPGGRCAS